ncbi:MAG: histidine--tRNA ligase [Desulfobulbaceae bacterium]|nr:histidine--tRNA ligase [Desulfobulbaceae bacterium]
MEITALNGFKDILPEEVGLWRQVEETARAIFARFAFQEIRPPVLEKTELFARSIGEATDIVEKEMYTFADKGITMRPEATAGLLRAAIERNLLAARPLRRLFTIGPMFRHERPQKGRLRQFHQLDVEALGCASPLIDAELMAMGSMLLERLGIKVSLEINSLGCPNCRPAYRDKLLAFIARRADQLCADCRRRSQTNPLRVLDCKNPECRAQVEDAPSILDHLCPDCAAHFAAVEMGLTDLQIPYLRNKFMVRGLDYYCRTTFEFITNDLGAQAAVGAGGRYDGLIEQLGGPKNTPGIGFAMGMERLVLLLQQSQEERSAVSEADVYIAALGEKAVAACLPLAHGLREHGRRVAMDYEGRGLKSQMKQADKIGAAWVLIVGDEELAGGQAVLRDMRTKEQRAVTLDVAAIGRVVGKE